jgi:putative oxidoreductase
MKITDLLFKTSNTGTALFLRLVLALVFFPHGAQKVLGWFGGYGFTGTMGFFTGAMHVPAVFAFLAIAAEFAGAIGLALGLFTRVAAFGILTNMLVAVYMVHGQFGFFMNWFGNQKGEGIEYHILAIAIALVLIVLGGGKFSTDGFIADKLSKK